MIERTMKVSDVFVFCLSIQLDTRFEIRNKEYEIIYNCTYRDLPVEITQSEIEYFTILSNNAVEFVLK